MIGAAILCLLVLEATRRSTGGVLVDHHSGDLGLCLHRAAHAGNFATKPVSLPRLIVYLGLDTNGMIGVILSMSR